MKLGRSVLFVCPETGNDLHAVVVRSHPNETVNLAVFLPGDECEQCLNQEDGEAAGTSVGNDVERSTEAGHGNMPQVTEQRVMHVHGVKFCSEGTAGTFHYQG